VSIKNKLATAVATASLLAGIFGSAFVPAAVATTTAKAAYTEIYTTGAGMTGAAVVGNGGTVGLYAADFTDADGDVTESTQDAAAATYVDIVFFESSFRCNDGGDGVGANDCIDGTRYGDLELTETVTSLKATSSNSDILVAWGLNDSGNAWGDDASDPADGDATDADEIDACNDIDNVLSPRGAVTSGSFAASDTIADSGGLTVHNDTLDRAYMDALGAERDMVGDATDEDNVNSWVLCIAAADDEVAATSTISLTVNGVAAGSFKVVAMNAPTKLELGYAATGYGKIAGDNTSVDAYFTVYAKDANGTTLNGSSTSISSLDLDAIGTESYESDDNAGDVEIDPFGGESTVPAREYLQDLAGDTCVTTEGEDDTGESYDVAFALNSIGGDADEDLTSNDLVINCVQSGEDARVTKVTPEATTGGVLYEEAGFDSGDDDGVLMLVATVVSANGSAVGDGSGLVCGDFDWAIEFTDENFLDETAVVEAVADDADGFMSDAVLGGVCDLGYFTPGAEDGDAHLAESTDDGLTRYGLFTYTVTASESDLSDPGTEKEFALSYRATGFTDTVTIAKVRNAAKTVATITFDGGEGAAYEPVYFQVEKANGAVVEYRRRANGDGIATLVLSRRNTVIYVYAFAETGDESDTIKVRFR